MLEFPNLEERVAVLDRLMDILTVSMAVSSLMEIIQAFFLMASPCLLFLLLQDLPDFGVEGHVPLFPLIIT